jgi:hypothetical protein
MEVSNLVAQHTVHYTKFVDENIAPSMQCAIEVAASDAEPGQAQELEKLMVTLVRLEQEANCRAHSLQKVQAAQGSAPDGTDLAQVYEEAVRASLAECAPVDSHSSMQQLRSKVGGDNSDDDGSDLEVDVRGGDDPERQYKCPVSGFMQWLENPVRPRDCKGNLACVFSKVQIEAHFQQGPNRGHDHVRCPIQGCNNYIKQLSDLVPDRTMQAEVKKARRRDERRVKADREAMDEDDLTQDLTQGGHS